MSNTSTQYASPLQLLNSFFSVIQIVSHADGKQEGTLELKSLFDAKSVEARELNLTPPDQKIWQVKLKVDLLKNSNVNPYYTGTVECIGLFAVSPNYPVEKHEEIVAVNGTGILYSSIRELITILTSRGPWPPLVLISQSFNAGFQEAKLRKLSSMEKPPK